MADTNQTQASGISNEPAVGTDGKAFDDFFESIGKQAAKTGGDNSTDNAPASLTDDEPRVVDEIESLCMNCHENVRFSPSNTLNYILLTFSGNYSFTLDAHSILSRNHPHVLLLSALQL